MANGKKERVAALTILIDRTTYKDSITEASTECIIMVTEREAGDDKWRLPRMQIPERILRSGPQTAAEHVREEMSRKIGFSITEPLTFAGNMTESKRNFLIFVGEVAFTVATDSAYQTVVVKSLQEMRFFQSMFSRFHYKIGERFLLKDKA